MVGNPNQYEGFWKRLRWSLTVLVRLYLPPSPLTDCKSCFQSVKPNDRLFLPRWRQLWRGTLTLRLIFLLLLWLSLAPKNLVWKLFDIWSRRTPEGLLRWFLKGECPFRIKDQWDFVGSCPRLPLWVGVEGFFLLLWIVVVIHFVVSLLTWSEIPCDVTAAKKADVLFTF